MSAETCIINGVVSIRNDQNSQSFDLDCSPTQEVQVKVAKVKTEKVKTEKVKIEKERINGLVPKVLADKVKNIVLWNPDVTLTDLLTKGLELVLKEYPEDLPVHGGKLKVGRRPKINPSQKVESNESNSDGLSELQRAFIETQEVVGIVG